MTREPLVSVVLSVYNDESFVRRSIDSVLAQEDVDLEVVAVNDGSKDASGAVLDEVAARDRRVRVIHQANAGLTRALALGCGEARGRFIARQDSDDLSLPGRLHRQAERLARSEAVSLVSCWARAIGPGDETLWEACPPDRPEEARGLVLAGKRGPTCHGSTMFRRADYEAVGGYRWQFWYGQDVDLWMRLCGAGALGLVEDVLYSYRVSGSSISVRNRAVQVRLGMLAHACGEARRQGRAEEDLLRQAATLRPPFPPSSSSARPGSGSYLIGRALLKRRDGRAGRYLRDALKENPTNWRALVSLGQLLLMRYVGTPRRRRVSR